MAATFTLYSSFRKYIMDGTVNLSSDTIKCMLVTSDYTPSVAHDILADVTASPTPEVADGDGYSTGGAEITGKAVTNTDSPSQGIFDATDLVWTALTKTFRYGIIYSVKSVGSPAIVNPLIGYILFDATPADVALTSTNFTIQWNANGIITA
jgi:hypothetical protein